MTIKADKDKWLVLIEGHIPTVDIIVRCLRAIRPAFRDIRIMTAYEINDALILSGEYQLLFIRTCHPIWVPLLNFMQRFRLHYAYYIDDNFWELKGNTAIAKCYQDKAVRDTLNQFIRNAQQVLTGSIHLADYIQAYLHVNAYCVNAAFDFSLISRLNQQSSQEKIKIIYAGSLYRDQDFHAIKQAILRISAEYTDKVTFCFYGYLPKELAHLPNVQYDKTFYKYNDFIQKQYTGGFDIGLAPLADTLSNRSKSNLKYREYAACRIVGIYTDIPPYSDCVIDQYNGILVSQTASAWYQAIKLLIDSPALRNKIKETAYDHVHSQFSTTHIAQEWQIALAKILKNKKSKLTYILLIQVFLYRKIGLLKYLTKRTMIYYQSHGLLFTLQKIMAHLLKAK